MQKERLKEKRERERDEKEREKRERKRNQIEEDKQQCQPKQEGEPIPEIPKQQSHPKENQKVVSFVFEKPLQFRGDEVLCF